MCLKVIVLESSHDNMFHDQKILLKKKQIVLMGNT